MHLLLHVIDCGGELVRPLSEAIADQQIACLIDRMLFLPPHQRVVDLLRARVDTHAQPQPAASWECERATRASVADLFAGYAPRVLDLLPRAGARVHEALRVEKGQRSLVDRLAAALKHRPVR